jgi:ABC-type Mn2+/Zn2+ transport system ATPase subunit
VIVYDIQGLVKTYPGQTEPANKNITLQIYQGEIFGILGDNGAGKSTLVRQMVNLLASDSGAIAPMLGIITLGSFAQGSQQPNLAYILTGNLVMGRWGDPNSVFSPPPYLPISHSPTLP